MADIAAAEAAAKSEMETRGPRASEVRGIGGATGQGPLACGFGASRKGRASVERPLGRPWPGGRGFEPLPPRPRRLNGLQKRRSFFKPPFVTAFATVLLRLSKSRLGNLPAQPSGEKFF